MLSRANYIDSEQTSNHEGFLGETVVEEEVSKCSIRRQLRLDAIRALLRRIELHDPRGRGGGIDAVREFVGIRTEIALLTAVDFARECAFPHAVILFEEEFGVVAPARNRNNN